MRIENIEVKLNKHCLYVLIFLKLLASACQNGGSNPIPIFSMRKATKNLHWFLMDDCRSFLSPSQVLVCLGVAGRSNPPERKSPSREGLSVFRIFCFFCLLVFYTVYRTLV